MSLMSNDWKFLLISLVLTSVSSSRIRLEWAAHTAVVEFQPSMLTPSDVFLQDKLFLTPGESNVCEGDQFNSL